MPRIPLSAPDITDAEIAAVTAVLRTVRLSLGPELEEFEKALASFHSVPYAVAVSSGTAGLHLALLTLGVGEGAEVIVPSFAFVAVANAVVQVRATPVFVDIDPVTLNLDPELVELAITSRTRAILVVHTFGVPAEMDRMREIANHHHLAIVEDTCEALGAEFGSKRVGGFGDLAVLGFYPNKQITTGEGGAVLARDSVHAARLRSLRNQGRIPGAGWLDHAEIGYNYRLSELACALGRVQLNRIDEILSQRRLAAEHYQAALFEIPGIEPPPVELPHRLISWFVYVVRLQDDSLGTQVSFEPCATGYMCSRLIRHRDGELLCPDSPAAGLERPPGCARAPSPPYRSHRRPHARATLLSTGSRQTNKSRLRRL